MTDVRRSAESTHGLVSPDDLPAASDRRYDAVESMARRGRLERLAPRTYRVVGSVSDWRQTLAAAVIAAGRGAAASHLSAAALWGLPGFGGEPVEVTRPRQRHHTGLIGRVHESRRFPETHRREVDGIAVTSVARTLFDLCGSREVHPKRAERAISNALSRGLVGFGALEVMLAQMGRRGRRGSALFRKIIDEHGAAGYKPTESELEDLVLAVLGAAGLPLPVRQPVLGGDEAPAGRVDFLYREVRFVIEADSRIFHSWLDAENDRRRDALLMAAGYRVLRVTWRTLREEPEIFVAAVRAILGEAASASAA